MGQPKAERRGRRAEQWTAPRRHRVGRGCWERPKAEHPAGEAARLAARELYLVAVRPPALAAGTEPPRAERPGRRVERRRAAHRAGATGLPTGAGRVELPARPAVQAVVEPRAAPSAWRARPGDEAVSVGRPEAGRGRAPGLVRDAQPAAPHAASAGVRAADASQAARRAAGARAWQEAVAGALPGRAAFVAGAEPAEHPVPRAVPGRAGPAVRLADAAADPAAADVVPDPIGRRRRPAPGPVGTRLRRRLAPLAKGQGPAGRSRPATSVSCALQFPFFVSTRGYQAARGLNR